jgi:lamin tail-like protein
LTNPALRLRCRIFLKLITEILCYDSKDMDRRRLLLYLLLNIFISVCVTSAILFWYDRNYRSVSISAVQPAAQALNQLSAPQPTLNPQVDIPVEIVSVIGAGTLNAEWVVVSYEGEDQINLARWELRDEDRHVFVFPQLVLHPNGAVQIHTASGTNTVIDLYWGESEPIWQSGELAQLFDPSGNKRAEYKVP